MTDPTVIQPSASGGSTTLPPTSPSRDSSSPTSFTTPSLSTTTSGSRPNTAPASPVRNEAISTTASQQMTAAPQQSTLPLKVPVSPARGQAPQGGGAPAQPMNMDSVVLGLQQLERQQAAQEQKRQAQAAQQPILLDSEDDSTAPSSTQNSNTNDDEQPQQESSIRHFINSTRKRLSSRDLKASAGNETKPSIIEPVTHAVYGHATEVSEAMQFEGGSNLLICGYLHKLGRNGKWQRRFFETDGENLSYYKTSARTKLLATLDLVKVGDICVDSEDPDGCTFIIQVADRPYRLRADSQSSCSDWVITLNRVKEARMHLGRVQLVRSGGSSQQEDASARVVLEANRQRTKAVDGENIHCWEDIVAAENAASAMQQEMDLSNAHATRLGTAGKRIQEAAVARWQKRQTSMQRLAARMVVWAKSVNIQKLSGCTDVEDQVVLDHHVHPPGHDHHAPNYGPNQATNRSSESSVASSQIHPKTRGSRDEDEEEETREIS